jgi:MFS family permease
MAQAGINVAASLGAVTGPLAIGALTNNDPINGWRKFYWIQFALWGVTALGIFFGYRPPKRHTDLDELNLWQKLGKLDLIGFFLLTAGLALFLTGLNLGGGLYAWSDGHVLGTLIPGLVILLCFAIFEWKGTRTGILHHDLFKGGKTQGRTFAICVSKIDGPKGNSNHTVATWCLALELTLLSIPVLV